MPKNQAHKEKKKNANRHNPLVNDIKDGQIAPKKIRQKTEKKQEEEDENYLPKGLSKRLLRQVQEQQEEVENESTEKKGTISALETPYETDEDAEEEHDVLEEFESLQIDPSDETTIEKFMGGGRKTLDLAAIIMQKLKEKEILVNAPEEVINSSLEPKVIAVYTQIASILEKYRSGRLPKAVKIIPLLTNWEEILFITRPESWSPAAVRQITRIFASNFNENLAQKYYNMVLLPQLREDIRSHKKLNWHLYMALKKALYKPAAFYKGILIPLCESRDCTLREAIIVGSVIRKVSVPAIQSSVALMKIAEMPYSGANSLFIKTLIDKKYALPLRVIDALVDHFLRFKDEDRVLPVVWHQALLCFAQRYKQEITADQKNKLKLLLREKSHAQITPEIRRELFSTKCRGESDSSTQTNNTDQEPMEEDKV